MEKSYFHIQLTGQDQFTFNHNATSFVPLIKTVQTLIELTIVDCRF